MAFGGVSSAQEWQADVQATALANHLGKVSLSGPPPQGQPRVRDGLAQKYALRDLEIQQTIGEGNARREEEGEGG